MRRGLAVTFFFTLVGTGCSVTNQTTTTEDPNSVTYSGPKETDYCSTVTTYTGGVTIQGDAQYVRREPNGTGLGSSSLTGLHHANAYPIRHAEIRISNSSGGIVQCAETDGVGHFSFILPSSGQTYTISVSSRSQNTFLYASVLDKPANNQFYSLTTSVVADASKSVGTMTAPANGTILAGAFNILDQLHFANDFLRSKAGSGLCSAVSAGCTDFTVAPKVSAYWMAGFNPNSYYGDTTNGLSFYLPGYYRLFILGGINGDTDNSDTDHFDNSVIVHEYGHFLENSEFKSDSPGGSHNGNKVIDPRLAWSEGWGNFFQAAVLNSTGYIDKAYNYVLCQTSPSAECPSNPVYLDTIGNADGTTAIAFSVNLETPDSHDNPNFAGEGNFREFDVTRTLWDLIDDTPTESTHGAFDDQNNQFVSIWASLTKSSISFKDATYAFRNVGLLHLIHKNLVGSNTWSNVQTVNWQNGDERDYAQYVSTGSTCSATSITPANVSGDTGSISTSDLFRNNDFYHLKINSPGTYTLQMDYQDADGLGTVADLDLYLYNSSARFGVSADIVGKSTNDPASCNGGATPAVQCTQTESFTVTLQPGDYLIDVYVFTGGTSLGTAANYSLKLNGSALCPANLVP